MDKDTDYCQWCNKAFSYKHIIKHPQNDAMLLCCECEKAGVQRYDKDTPAKKLEEYKELISEMMKYLKKSGKLPHNVTVQISIKRNQPREDVEHIPEKYDTFAESFAKLEEAFGKPLDGYQKYENKSFEMFSFLLFDMDQDQINLINALGFEIVDVIPDARHVRILLRFARE